MSSTSFLAQTRKGASNKTARTIKELANKQAKIYSQSVVIEDEGLLDQGRVAKNRVVLDHRLTYTRKITAIPAFYVPVEPDAQYLTFWVKGNHVGHTLYDLSTFDNEIICNNNKHWCIVDSGGLDEIGRAHV